VHLEAPEEFNTAVRTFLRGTRSCSLLPADANAEHCPRAGVGGHFRRAVAPRVLGRLPADLGYELTAD
jgi:hypothetical protein